MKKLIMYILLLLFISAPVLAADTNYGTFSRAHFVRNYDGDTITVNIFSVHPIIGDEVNIRVNGIDTPEIRGGCIKSKALAIEAKELVNTILIKAKRIKLENCQRGKYFRISADVIVDGVNLADILLKTKLAVPYSKYTTKTYDWCQ